MNNRVEYSFDITINKRKFSKVIIDQHYKEKHPDINDELILELVKEINNGIYPNSDVNSI